jgi:hypothetical protein
MIQPPTITMVDLKVNNYSFFYKKNKEPNLIQNHGLEQIEIFIIKSTNREPPVLFSAGFTKTEISREPPVLLFLSNRDKWVYYDSVL